MPDWVQSQIPAIAWTVPNLEAYARVELIDEKTNQPAACLQATLSNGKTTQQTAVKWATGMFTLAAGIIALIHSMLVNSISPALYRWFDVLFLYQTAAAAGMMHLNYPLAFSNFVQNFHWSFALFHSEPMQNSINKMRNHTGGHLGFNAHSDVQYINRKLSPYNVQSMVDLTDLIGDGPALKSFFADQAAQAANNSSSIVRSLYRRAAMPSLVDQNHTTDLTTGIPQYVETRNIPYANAYDTIFFFFLAFVAIVLAFHALLALPVFTLSRSSPTNAVTRWATRLRSAYWDLLCANLLRACLVFFLPIFTFGFYQWTIGTKDSGLNIFWALFGILAIAIPLCTVFILSLRRAKQESVEKTGVSLLYTDFHLFQSTGHLYRQFKASRWFFWFAPYVLAMFTRSAFIGFGQSNPWAQVIGCLVVETLLLLSLIVWRPEQRRAGNLLSIVLSLFRLILFGLLIAFLETLHVKPIPRTVIGIVEIAIVGIPTILLLISVIWNAGYGILWRRHRAPKPEDGAELERASFDMYRDEKGRNAGSLETDSRDSSGPSTPPDVGLGYTPMLRGKDSFGKPAETESAESEHERTSDFFSTGVSGYQNQLYPQQETYPQQDYQQQGYPQHPQQAYPQPPYRP